LLVKLFIAYPNLYLLACNKPGSAGKFGLLLSRNHSPVRA
jgi:hypothetical protein